MLTTKFKVHMLGNMNGQIREVILDNENVVSDDKELLEYIFRYGQNDNQPVEGICSVSCGDVAEIDSKFYICGPTEWSEISSKRLEQYRSLTLDGRTAFWKNRY